MAAKEWSYEDIDKVESILVEDGQVYLVYSDAALRSAYQNLIQSSHYHQEVASSSETTKAAMSDIEKVRFTSIEFAKFLGERGFTPDRRQSADSASRLFVRTQVGVGAPTVGDVGPNGGTVFWVGTLADGSSAFLEAASSDWYPPTSDCPMVWSLDTDLTELQGNSRAIGECILNRDAIDKSDILCAPQFQIEQFLDEDWCLPTIEELKLMYSALAKNGLGDFSGSQYWSSSVVISPYVLSLRFDSGEEMFSMSDLGLFVRPVRLTTF
ncbi:MAG: hypothetical protein ACKOHN_03640 [Actinomycetota bacterium]